MEQTAKEIDVSFPGLKDLPNEVKDFFLKKYNEEGISWLGLSNEQIIGEYEREKSKLDEERVKEERIKNRESRIREAEILKNDAIKTVNQLITNRGFSEDDFELDLRIRNKDLKPKISRSKGKNILKIDRSQPFNPATFPGLNSQWSIWRGPVNGNGLEGAEDQDKNSLALAEIDLDQIELVTMLNNGKTSIKGEEKLIRLKNSNYIRLDSKIYETLKNNQHLIPEKWKERINGNIQYIFFDGTVLRDPYGNRRVLYLCWDDARWDWYYYWLEYDWDASDPSAVLAST